MTAETVPALRPRTAVAAGTYVVFVAGTALLVWTAIRLGGAVAGTTPPDALAPASKGAASWHLLAAVGGIALFCRAGGAVARRLGQSAVIGEIAAGVLLGPSVLGAFAPGLLDALLPSAVLAQVGVLGNLGVTLFAFGLGADVDLARMRDHTHAAIWVSHASIAVPFVSGCFLALALPASYRPPGPFAPFCLFVGAAMSITAFPVLGRILEDTGLIATPLGRLSIVCAAVDDVTAWTGLAFIVAVTRGDAAGAVTLRTIALGVALALVVLRVAQPLLAREPRPVALLLAFALAVAAASDRLGLHAIFGAFLAGCAMPRPARPDLRQVGRFVDGLLLPLFFVTAGLQVDLRWLVRHPGALGVGALIIAVAVVGKLGAGAVAARLAGLPRREAAAIGVLMNTRGLTELVILQLGLELGVLPRSLYTLLVLMALVTTAMTTPLLRLLRMTR